MTPKPPSLSVLSQEETNSLNQKNYLHVLNSVTQLFPQPNAAFTLNTHTYEFDILSPVLASKSTFKGGDQRRRKS